MNLISCGKSVCLHSFPSLETLSTYGQTEGCYDFQFFRKSAIFIASNSQTPTLEYFSLKSRDGIEAVTLLKRIKTQNLSTIACPKNHLEFVATGFSTGQINLMNYKTKEISYRFNAGSLSNGVTSLDFNATDDYLASTLESGEVKVFGLKSFIEVDSFSIDKNTILARYHPTKRFQLMLASHMGSVTLYEGQTKKKILHVNRAHTSPCRDLVASHINENCLFSAGLDCYINIYDTRKKAIVQQVKTEHPLSTLTLSPSSLECIVGNLKGELVVFDARKLTKPLTKTKVHEGLVSRLTFVPQEKDNLDVHSSIPVSEDEMNPVTSSMNDSVDVFDMLPLMKKDHQHGKSSSTDDEKRRDSFMDFLKACEVPDGNSRKSLDRRSLTRRSSSRSNEDLEEEKENRIDVSNVTFRKKRTSTQRRSTTLFTRISEEGVEEGEDDHHKEAKTEVAEGNAENSDEPYKTPNSFTEDLLPACLNSTPNPPPGPDPNDLKREIGEMLKRTENSILYDMETYKWQTYGEMFSLWQNQNHYIESLHEKIDDLTAAVGLMMQSNAFVAEFHNLQEEAERLQQENQVLKQQLMANLSTK